MSPNLPTTNLTSQVPSTKAWLLLLSLLTGLLLAGSRAQLPVRGVAPAVVAGRSAQKARPATTLAPTERRVALKSPARPAQAATAFAL
jgi:hypothetical protein